MSPTLPLDIKQILKILPHRYPFVLIDRVLELQPASRILAYKNVTYNEPFFQGHFPDNPVMPGVLIIEAMGQTGIILVVGSLEDPSVLANNLFLFTGIERARFRAPVRPGDRLELECYNLKHKMQLWKMDAKAYVDGKVVAEAAFTASVMPREAF